MDKKEVIKLSKMLGEAAERREKGDIWVAEQFEEIVFNRCVDVWDWELGDETGVKRRAPYKRIGYLINKF
jgi:hypothetical protein